MDYESFKEKFVEDVKDRLYEQGAEVDLSIHTVNKLNESYEAITVTPEGSNIGVNIGIDKFYGAVENGRPYDEVVDKAVDVINNGINQRPEFDINSLSDYSQMKEKLAMEVVSAEANKEMLETVPHQLNEANEDNNAGGEAINAGSQLAENGIYSIKKRAGKSADKSGYGDKLHGKTVSKAETIEAHEAQKNLMKKEIQRHAFKEQARETANASGGFMKRFVDKAEDMAGKIAEAVREFVEDHPLGLLIAAVVLIVVLVLSGALSSCSMMAGGGSNSIIATSFTAQDADIIAVENDYKELEADLQTKLDNIETDYPGYDEYQYSLSEISHNPFELAALLTVLYEDYTESEAQSMLQTVFDYQYDLTKQRIVETRTRTETRTGTRTIHHADGTTTTENYTYEVEVEYE